MTLALELVGRGVACRIIDAAAGPAPTSRAIAVQPRTLELLDILGIAGKIERRGIPQTGIQLNNGNRVLARIPHMRFPYDATCIPQTETETVLREALERAGVSIEWSGGITGFKQTSDGVVADVGKSRVAAGWLVGCDGAHSVVRHALGIGFAGTAMPETNLMADVEADWDLDGGDVRIWFHPDGVLVVLHQPGNVWRLIASVRDSERTPTEGFFTDVLARRAGVRARHMKIRWMSAFQVHTRLATSYRDGRVFLAGDAAHVHSPAGGQGMNLGMQDAINLGWKLAHVIGGGADRVLDSYEVERRPVAAHVMRTTEPLTRIGVASSPIKRMVRDRVLPFALSLPPIRRSMALQASGIALSYAKSPLSAAGGGGRAPFRRGFYRGTWEVFMDSSGSAVLVRPDAYIAARFHGPHVPQVRQYLLDRIGGGSFVDDGRQLPGGEVEAINAETSKVPA